MNRKTINLCIMILYFWLNTAVQHSESKKVDETASSTTSSEASTPNWNLTAFDYMKMFAPDKVKFLPKNLTVSETTTTEVSTQDSDTEVTETEETDIYETDTVDTYDADDKDEALDSKQSVDLNIKNTTNKETSILTTVSPNLTKPYAIKDKQTLNAESPTFLNSKATSVGDPNQQNTAGTELVNTKTSSSTALPPIMKSKSTNEGSVITADTKTATKIIKATMVTKSRSNSSVSSHATTPSLSKTTTKENAPNKHESEIKHALFKNDLLEKSNAVIVLKSKNDSTQFTPMQHLLTKSPTTVKPASLAKMNIIATGSVATEGVTTESVTTGSVTTESVSNGLTAPMKHEIVVKSLTSTESGDTSEVTYATTTDTTVSALSSTADNSIWFKSAIPKFVNGLKKLNGSAINKTSIDYSKFNTKPGTVITTSASVSSAIPPHPSDDKYWSKQKQMSTGMLTGLILMIVLAVVCAIASIFAIQRYRHQKVEDSIALMSNRHGHGRPFYYYDSTI